MSKPEETTTVNTALNVLDAGDNAMVCDLETGLCGPADAVGGADEGASGGLEPITFRPTPKVDVYYVTDPICSHCWALEPTLRRFTEEYGRHLDVKTVMGGLLPGWNGFADRANGIGNPADVAGHWREVGDASRMPIDGSVWLRDPLSSSYPPSRVYVVIREKDAQLAQRFLRRMREALFAFDRNIADPAVLAELVDGLGLDGKAVVAEADSERGQELLERDIALARGLGVRGFPTLVFVNDEGQGVKVSGVRALGSYVQALESVLAGEPRPRKVPNLNEALEGEGLFFSKEIEVLYDVAPANVGDFVAEQLAGAEFETGEVLGETFYRAPVAKG